MLKRLNKKEVQAFTDKFQIKCSSVTLERIQEEYFIIIDELIRFKVKENLIESFL